MEKERIMKKISVLLCLLMAAVFLFAACGSQNAATGSMEESADTGAADEGASVINPADVACEARYFENDQLTVIEQYDDQGRLLSSEGDVSDEYHYFEEYRATDAAAAIDLGDLAEVEGVSSTDCRQVYYRMLSESDALAAQPTYLAFGYDENGAIKVTRLYYQTDEMEAPVVIYQVVFDLNENGDAVHAVKTAGNGDVVFERDYTNEYDGETLVAASITGTFYGNQVYQDNTTVRDTLDTPVSFSSRVEYTHA